jgi:hypothetical protein
MPIYLTKIYPPLCTACVYGKSMRTPCRTKAELKKAPKVVMSPGESIAIDQLEARFTGQLKDAILTNQ